MGWNIPWNEPYLLNRDPIPPNLGELTKWISVLLQILKCLEGQTFWEKWGEITHQELSVYYIEQVPENSKMYKRAKITFLSRLIH